MARIDQIQIRRDTAANWTATNPILAVGELGAETNTRRMKMGDGATAWNALLYMWEDGTITITDTFVVASQAAMLAAAASKGDVAIRTDTSQTYILTADPATTLANWQLLPTPGAATNMTGATAGAAGTAGLAPAPAAGQQNSFLRGDGTWAADANFTGATAVAAGAAGNVPQPVATQQDFILRGDGSWRAGVNGGTA